MSSDNVCQACTSFTVFSEMSLIQIKDLFIFFRDEIRQERGRASRQEQRANDLENVVKNIKSKICQLEDETIAKVCQQQNQVKELQKDQQVSQVIQIVLSEDSNF